MLNHNQTIFWNSVFFSIFGWIVIMSRLQFAYAVNVRARAYPWATSVFHLFRPLATFTLIFVYSQYWRIIMVCRKSLLMTMINNNFIIVLMDAHHKYSTAHANIHVNFITLLFFGLSNSFFLAMYSIFFGTFNPTVCHIICKFQLEIDVFHSAWWVFVAVIVVAIASTVQNYSTAIKEAFIFN